MTPIRPSRRPRRGSAHRRRGAAINRDSLPALAPAADFKKKLKDMGLNLQMTYIGEVLGNVSGGRQQGVIYDGRMEFLLEADMEKIANWQGGLCTWTATGSRALA